MDGMNYPTSDIQFLAEMLRRVRRGDQIAAAEAHRLDVLAASGHSSSADEVEPVRTPVTGPLGADGGQI